jgi:hypothetical protein
MTKTKIIQQLKEILAISKQDNDEFLAECRKKYPDTPWERAYPIKLGLIESKIEFLLMFLEADVKEEEKHGRQAEDLRQAVGDIETDKTSL